MAVFDVITFEVKPGRREEFLTDIRDFKGLIERVDVGLTSVRLAEAMLAGSTSGQVVMVVEQTDLTSWGTSVDREKQDEAMLALESRWQTADPPARMVSHALLTEIPL
jgi:hypothetical protein